MEGTTTSRNTEQTENAQRLKVIPADSLIVVEVLDSIQKQARKQTLRIIPSVWRAHLCAGAAGARALFKHSLVKKRCDLQSLNNETLVITKRFSDS